MPSIGNGFQVLAFLGNPASVSRTPAYLVSAWRVILSPDTIDRTVAVGQEITVRAEIVNRLDQHVGCARLGEIPESAGLQHPRYFSG